MDAHTFTHIQTAREEQLSHAAWFQADTGELLANLQAASCRVDELQILVREQEKVS